MYERYGEKEDAEWLSVLKFDLSHPRFVSCAHS